MLRELLELAEARFVLIEFGRPRPTAVGRNLCARPSLSTQEGCAPQGGQRPLHMLVDKEGSSGRGGPGGV